MSPSILCPLDHLFVANGIKQPSVGGSGHSFRKVGFKICLPLVVGSRFSRRIIRSIHPLACASALGVLHRSFVFFRFGSPSRQLLELIVKPDERDATTVLSRAVDSRSPTLLKSVLEFVQQLVQEPFEPISLDREWAEPEVRNDGGLNGRLISPLANCRIECRGPGRDEKEKTGSCLSSVKPITPMHQTQDPT